MWLAGDLGGTKTLLGVFAPDTPRPRPVDVREFVTLDYGGLGALVTEFLRTTTAVTPGAIQAVVVGVAGPVIDQEVELTNVPWRVSGAEVREATGVDRVWLLNDVEAMGYAVEALEPSETVVLHAGRPAANGQAVLVTVGTGFGQTFLPRFDGRLVPRPSEGGHVDFPARTDAELDLVRALRAEFGRVDVERVISGAGLANIARVLHGGHCPVMPPDVDPGDVPAYVSEQALSGTCATCAAALVLMVDALGSMAGNLAIATVARAGVFIGGGIPAKILPALQRPSVLHAFLDKPPMHDLLREIPLSIIVNPHAGLLGAAIYASRLAAS